jgi:hypothetical protein
MATVDDLRDALRDERARVADLNLDDTRPCGRI